MHLEEVNITLDDIAFQDVKKQGIIKLFEVCAVVTPKNLYFASKPPFKNGLFKIIVPPEDENVDVAPRVPVATRHATEQDDCFRSCETGKMVQETGRVQLLLHKESLPILIIRVVVVADVVRQLPHRRNPLDELLRREALEPATNLVVRQANATQLLEPPMLRRLVKEPREESIFLTLHFTYHESK